MPRLFATKSTSESLLVYLVFGFLFAALFTPLIFSGKFFFPYIFSKAYYFRIFVELALVAYVWLLATAPQWKPRISWVWLAVTGYVAVAYLASIFGINFHRSFWSNAERSEGLLMLTHVWLYFTLLHALLRTRDQWRVFFHTALGVAFLATIYALDQKWQVFIPQLNKIFQSLGLSTHLSLAQAGTDRLTSTIGNAAFFAAYLLLNIVLAAYVFFYHQGKIWLRAVYGAVLAFFILILFYTATRGAILGLLGGVFLYSFALLALHANKKMRAAGAAVLCAILLFGAAVWTAKDTAFVQNTLALQRLTSISLTDPTTISRLATWKASWTAFTEHPILGIGYENYRVAFNKHFPITLYDIRAEQWFDRAHTIIFDILVTSGITGFIAYASIFCAVFWSLRKLVRDTESAQTAYGALILVAGLAAYVAQNLFVFDTLPTYMIFFAILAYVGSQTPLQENDRITQRFAAFVDSVKRFTPKPHPVILAGVVTIVVFWVHVQVNILPARANRALAQAIMEQSNGKYADALRHFRESMALDTNQQYEVRQRFSEFLLSNNLDQRFTQEEIAQLYKEGTDALEQNITAYGDDMQHHAYLLSLYERAVNADPSYLERAIAVGEEAIAKSPTRPHTYFTLARLEARTGTDAGKQRALELMHEAAALSPQNPEMYLNLIHIDLVLGLTNQAEADYQQLTELTQWRQSPGSMRKLAELYIFYKNYHRAIELYQDAVATGHEQSQDHIRLAALYYETQQLAEAKAAAVRAAELDAALAKETAAFIAQIDQVLETSP